MNSRKRGDLPTNQTITSSSPYISRIMAPHKANNKRESIARLSEHILELEEENKNLTETVEFLHGEIWDLVHKNRGIGTNIQETDANNRDSDANSLEN